jgi:hypothetical protein
MKTKVIFILLAVTVSCLIVFYLASRRKESIPTASPQGQTDNGFLGTKKDDQDTTPASVHTPASTTSLPSKPTSRAIQESSAQTESNELLEVDRTGSPVAAETPQTEEQLMRRTNETGTTEAGTIASQQAVGIASAAVGNVSYDREAGVSVEHESGHYVVTFPIKKPEVRPGERYRGSPYVARVVVDEKTGKIIEIRAGR